MRSDASCKIVVGCPQRTSPRGRETVGVTLLELILALALAAIVMAAVVTAINLHLKAFDARRTNVEEAQLARAVLGRIADDLRSAVPHGTVDFTEAARLAGNLPELSEEDLEELEGGEIPGGLFGEGNQGDGGGDDDFGSGDSSDEEDEETNAENRTPGVTPASVPGIYGNRYQLQVDVSYLPRIEDFQTAADAGVDKNDLPSDVKTVAYYLMSNSAGLGSAPSSGGESVFGRLDASGQENLAEGLVRRSLDRSTTQWAIENGDVARLDRVGQILAPEVIALEFRYFDGEAWSDVWDSQQRGGLPVAVEVALAIVARDTLPGDDAPLEKSPTVTDLDLADQQALAGAVIYRQTIRIPAAEPTFDAEAVETTEAP